jgi:hypothetical protein
MAVVVAVAILWLSRTYTFYFDEWSFILTAPDWTWITYLQPHNEHPSMLFRLAYLALLKTFGLRSYVPYMAVLVALHAVNVVLLFHLVRRRAGELIAFGSAALLVFLGAGWEDLLWAFQMAWLASIACGLGMLLTLEEPSSRRRLIAAVLLLTTSLMFSGIGLFFGVVAGVKLTLTPSRRLELAWFAPVGAALLAWYLAFGHTGAPTVPAPSAANLALLPGYVGWGLAGSAAGIIGVTGSPALVVLLLAAGAIGFAWWRQRPDPLAVGMAAGLLTFYVVTGLTRAQLGFDQSASGRYVYVGAVFWLILLADAARRVPWSGTWRPALAALIFLACFNSSVLLVAYAAGKTAVMQREVADLQALAVERSDRCLDPAGAVDPLVVPYITSPALYYRAIDRFGDPTNGLAITDRPDFDRARSNLVRSGCTPTYT